MMMKALCVLARLRQSGAITLAGLLVAVPAHAIEHPVEGGPGGSFFRVKCDGFMTGFEGRTGAVIDHFRIRCGDFDANARTIQFRGPLPVTVGTSQGGGPSTVTCPAGWGLKSINFKLSFADGGKPGFVHHINFVCVSIADGQQIARTYGSTQPIANLEKGIIFKGKYLEYGYSQTCPAGELAVGFAGRSGLYVDALGLICAPIPAAAPPPKPQETVQPPPKVIKPLAKSKIEQKPDSSGEGFTGTWDTRTDKGWKYTMTLVQEGREVRGSYVAQDGSKGRINGRFGANIMEFTWQQDGGFSGTGQFALAADGKSFTGIYRSNPHPKLTDPKMLQGSWNGTRR